MIPFQTQDILLHISKDRSLHLFDCKPTALFALNKLLILLQHVYKNITHLETNSKSPTVVQWESTRYYILTQFQKENTRKTILH